MLELIQNNIDLITKICKHHKVESISVFGSAAKDTMHEGSDIDLLVNFSDEVKVLEYADNYFSLLDKLQKVFNRKIDLLTEKSLKNPVLKEEIYRSKIDLYAA